MTRKNIRQTKKSANLAQAAAVPPSPVYEQRLGDIAGYPDFQAPPHSIFFYHISPENGLGFRKVTHYYSPGTNQPLTTHAQVKAKVTDLVVNARLPNASRRPPPIGADWNYVVWDRKSYLAIFIDDPQVALYSPAIDFNKRPSTYDTENYSFFDAWVDTIDNRPVIFCINHMKMDNAGHDLDFNVQYFHFDLKTNPPLLFSTAYPDSGGTNMGPPIGPP